MCSSRKAFAFARCANRHSAVHRRRNFGVSQARFRRFELRLCVHRLRLRRRDGALGGVRLVRARLRGDQISALRIYFPMSLLIEQLTN